MKGRSIPLLAVDGGGTKCLAVFTDRQGKIEGTGRGGSCNYQTTGKEAAVDELVRAMKIAREDLTEPPAPDETLRVECAVFGMAGLDTGYDRQIIEGLVREALSRAEIQADRVVVENDGLAALLGATDGKPGVLLIAGTGSIVYGVNGQGRSARAGAGATGSGMRGVPTGSANRPSPLSCRPWTAGRGRRFSPAESCPISTSVRRRSCTTGCIRPTTG